ncbi:hypothetical protein [Pseudoalteromonas arctica]|uniref:Uncharacterized protein n=1 Tax=Pseudoalteromonas arctica TaxID=394751 RepID=A0A7Y0DTM0_9GAMM|nr:hypothetical protein [Pseudoalteromonas arctica]NMM40486.1 hypothetical protein [Pseudoalteromonas arctica]
MSKLTDHDISLIIELRKTLSINVIADKFDVSEATIRYHLSASNQHKKQSLEILNAVKSDIAKGIKTSAACKKNNISTIRYQQLNKSLNTRRGVAI